MIPVTSIGCVIPDMSPQYQWLCCVIPDMSLPLVQLDWFICDEQGKVCKTNDVPTAIYNLNNLVFLLFLLINMPLANMN